MKYKKVLLLFPDYAGGYFGALRPPAGIGYLAQILQENRVEYDILDLATGRNLSILRAKILSFKPDLVAISLMSFMYKRSYYIINYMKDISSGITVVAGGPHISTLREKALEELRITYPYEQELVNYTISKLNISKDEFEHIMNLPIQSFHDYSTYYPIIKLLRFPIWVAAKTGIIPYVLYQKFFT